MVGLGALDSSIGGLEESGVKECFIWSVLYPSYGMAMRLWSKAERGV